jgi:polysaccharide export outer membrane protein
VRVRVIEYNSQQIFLIGQVAGSQRVVPYEGSQTVVDLLHRIGGLTAGAAPEDVYVVRSRLAEGKRPEVFRVDLRAILLNNDPSTNITLQPLDQIFVGESRQCSFEKCIPPWLRPLYETFCGMRGNSTRSPAQATLPRPRQAPDLPSSSLSPPS